MNGQKSRVSVATLACAWFVVATTAQLFAQDVPHATHAEPTFFDAAHDGAAACAECGTGLVYSDFALNRVPVSVFELDPATPTKMIRLRYDAGYNWERPDRVEYFWARNDGNGKGPQAVERSVDYQDIRLYYENGAGPISFLTELPIRSVDPEINPDTTGLGDMNVGIKSQLYKGDWLEVSSIFRTIILTGSPSHGTGTGHVSMEPGLLATYRPIETTTVHSELKYWFPIGADNDYAGQVLRWGFGAAHLLYEHPTRKLAVVTTAEMIAWHVLDGLATLPDGTATGVDDVFILNLQPGMRVLVGEKFDVGVSGAWAITDRHWYESLVRMDLRLLF